MTLNFICEFKKLIDVHTGKRVTYPIAWYLVLGLANPDPKAVECYKATMLEF